MLTCAQAYAHAHKQACPHASALFFTRTPNTHRNKSAHNQLVRQSHTGIIHINTLVEPLKFVGQILARSEDHEALDQRIEWPRHQLLYAMRALLLQRESCLPFGVIVRNENRQVNAT